MKKISLLLYIFSLMSVATTAQSLKTIWVSQKVFKVPESVFYNAATHQIYVSNINGSSSAKDGNGFISMLDKQGKIIQLQWIKGLNAPKGMAVEGTHLYVSDIDRLVEIDLTKGKIIRSFPAAGAKFLNDVAIDTQGHVFVSDTQLGAIYRLINGHLGIWKESPVLSGANGLAMENGLLLVGARGQLLSIDPETGIIKKLVGNPGGIDGLIPLGNGRYLVSDWAGKIQLISRDHQALILSNTTAEKINAADLGFNRSKKIVYIPTFFDNRVIAKQLNAY